MDIFDLLDLLVDPILDFILCRGKFGIWIRKQFASFFLALGSFVFLLMLIAALCYESVIGILMGAIGLAFFVISDVRYTVWWIREGRHGEKLPIPDALQAPKGDCMGISPEERFVPAKPEENVWDKLDVRK